MKKRTSLALLCFALCFSLLFSAIFIALEHNHDCTGKDCRVCACVSFLISIMREVAQAGALVVAAALIFGMASFVLKKADQKRGFSTPVSLRVKLTN